MVIKQLVAVLKISTTHNDLDLLERVKHQKDHKAFEELYQRHFASLFRYVFKVMQDKDTAEDLIQNIFMDLWNRHPVTPITSLQAYLFGSARNQIAKEIRRNKWNKTQLEYLENIHATLSTDEYMAELETRTHIESAILKLPQKCRHVFELSRFNYLSNKEIAGRLGISVFTVENHIKKALYQIRQSLLLLFIFMMLALI